MNRFLLASFVGVFHWVRHHKWLLLLLGTVSLLVISPIPRVYDEQDNLITPLVAGLLLMVVFGTTERWWVTWPVATLVLVWLIVSIATEGSGLFVGLSTVAPVCFMILLMAIFVLLVRWLIRADYIGSEVLCAAICGYLLVGVFWMTLYCVVLQIDPKALAFSNSVPWDPKKHQLPLSDLLYFSYTTLTTTGFGDITPTNPIIRMLTVLEAIVGTFYNTIIIARFVGLYGVKREIRD